MNNQRRKQIAKVIGMLEEAVGLVDEIHSEEGDAFDNMPESLQESERGQASSEAVDALGESRDAIEEALSALEGID